MFFYESFLFKLPLLKKYDAITLGRFVFCKDKKENIPSSLVTHELVHIEQVKEAGVFSFYAAYLLYYLAGMVRFKDHDRAYRKNPFEVEAYNGETKHELF